MKKIISTAGKVVSFGAVSYYTIYLINTLKPSEITSDMEFGIGVFALFGGVSGILSLSHAIELFFRIKEFKKKTL
jgi:hypothetical protein